MTIVLISVIIAFLYHKIAEHFRIVILIVFYFYH